MRRVFCFIFLTWLGAQCVHGAAPAEGDALSRTVTESYAVNGVLLEVRGGGRKALIAHRAIPGYMAAMTMEFEVEGALGDANPGDAISFRLQVSSTHGWIDQVKKSAAGVAKPAPAMAPAAAVALLGPGDLMPDCALTDSAGRPFRLNDFRGRSLALGFIFTRCPFPDYCPRLNAQFAEVQKALLAAEPGLAARLCSISIDPEYDTPQRLAEYSQRYEASPERWVFATGKPAAIAALGGGFGLTVLREGDTINHTLRTVVVDGAGRVRRVFVGNEWRAEELLDELRRTER